TRADLVKFHDEWFVPSNATLVVVGDTSLAELTPALEKLFATWKGGHAPKKNIASVTLPTKPTVYIVNHPGPQSVIVAANVAPPTANPEEIAIDAMNDALGGTFSGRVNMNLREDKHWSYGARTTLVGARGQRPFLAIAPVQVDKTKESLAEMSRELKSVIS